MGPAAAELFPWGALMSELEKVRRELSMINASSDAPGLP
jgi:hypothetical protein